METVATEETEVIIFDHATISTDKAYIREYKHRLNKIFFVSILIGDGSAGKNGKNATQYVSSFF